MFTNYRRNFFLSLIIIGFLLITNSSFENSIQNSLGNLLGIKSSQNIEMYNIFENIQLLAKDSALDLSKFVSINQASSSGVMSFVWQFFALASTLITTLASNIYLFYITLAALLYFVLTSRIFKNSYDY